MPFFQKIFGTSQDYHKSAVKFSNFFWPLPIPPLKIFIKPLPSPQDFWPGSCMILTHVWYNLDFTIVGNCLLSILSILNWQMISSSLAFSNQPTKNKRRVWRKILFCLLTFAIGRRKKINVFILFILWNWNWNELKHPWHSFVVDESVWSNIWWRSSFYRYPLTLTVFVFQNNI